MSIRRAMAIVIAVVMVAGLAGVGAYEIWDSHRRAAVGAEVDTAFASDRDDVRISVAAGTLGGQVGSPTERVYNLRSGHRSRAPRGGSLVGVSLTLIVLHPGQDRSGYSVAVSLSAGGRDYPLTLGRFPSGVKGSIHTVSEYVAVVGHPSCSSMRLIVEDRGARKVIDPDD